MVMVKKIFLEGIPCSGKSYLLQYLSKEGNDCIEEVVVDLNKLKKSHNKSDQRIFMENEDIKKSMAASNKKDVFIDRSPISVLAYNICKNKLDNKHDYSEVLFWYLDKYYKDFMENDNCYFVYLRNKDYLKKTDFSKDPYGNSENLKALSEVYESLMPILVKKLLIIEDKYKDNNIKEIIEFIND